MSPRSAAALPVGRRAQRQRETRTRLRQAGYELMSAHGVDATTVQQITEAADVGFGTFYNYAESKEALARDVLDCVIHNIGERNDLVTKSFGETDPVRIVANSVRFVIAETTTDPLWRWWFARIEVLVDRIRLGFGPFGLRDIAVAVQSGQYRIVGDDHGLAWSQLCWMMTGAAADIVAGHIPPEREAAAVEGILRVMGVDHGVAAAACSTPAPTAPTLPIDFNFDFAAIFIE